MKQVMKTFSQAALAFCLLVPAAGIAQNTPTRTRIKDVDQITITRKGENKDKLVVEINGDKILVNGKEYSKGDSNIVISRNRVKDVYSLNYNRKSTPVARGFDGTQFFELFSEGRAMLGVSTETSDKGVLVQDITKESAAEKAGLLKGDIIKKVDDTKIETPDDLSKYIQSKKAGDKVEITYIRDKKEKKVKAELQKWNANSFMAFGDGLQNFNFKLDNLELEELLSKIPSVPNPPAAPRARAFRAANSSPLKLGLSVQDTEDGKGVKVISTEDDGAAFKSGVKEGDIIQEVDGKEVNSTDALARLVRENRDKASFKFKVARKGKTENIEVKIPRKLNTAEL